MLFVSEPFVLFLAVVMLALAAVGHPGARRWIVFASCLWFYGSWSGQYLLLLLGTVTVDWALALAMTRWTARSRLLLAASVTLNLGVLATFKYAAFGAGLVNDGVRLAGLGVRIPVPELILPLGISFYVFQSLSYTIDVYRGKLAPTRDWLKFATFVLFFPHLVAGPLVRAQDILPQLDRLRVRASTADIAEGVRDFVLGFARKVVFADSFAGLADATFADPARYRADALFVGLVAYALQIYFDFSGYSQMAIGLARMLGVRFPQNFDAPYVATSLRDFWRRWHISLSQFLRDYVYVPLGGSRHGARRTAFALLATMLLGGLWHGANTTFLAWGGVHGLALVGAHVYRGRMSPAHASFWESRAGGVAGWILTQATVLFAWIWFRAPTHDVAAAYVRGLLGGGGSEVLAVTPLQVGLFGAAAAIHAIVLLRPGWAVPWPRGLALQGAVAGALYVLLATFKAADAPFLYFQF